ncbi:MAG TPA: SET domain-containing protein-lysine N-methyltransferase [Gemmataceae bacterium]|nr:SET domain-containing protein-lysine N-methyltransferase [Gemmataceae bacterium]
MLEVRQTPHMGRGVFAVAPIPRGACVAVCQGWLATTAELRDTWHAMQVGPDLWLCSDGNNLDDCINHSCDPNVGFTTGEPSLHALRDIAIGEQLAWDYSTSIAEPGWTLACLCGTPTCRHVIRSWWELDGPERDRLRPLALIYLR